MTVYSNSSMPETTPVAGSQPIKHCPTCDCQHRRRYEVTDDLLRQVADDYARHGIAGAALIHDRSRSQIYRLLAEARSRDLDLFIGGNE